MNKLTLFLLSSVLITTASQACSSFTGFYMGGHLGWVQKEDSFNVREEKFNDPDFPPSLITLNGAKFNKKLNGLGYGIFVGYGKDCQGLYLGAEVSIENDSASKTVYHTPNEPVADVGIPPVSKGKASIRMKYERGMVIGFAPRVGVIISNSNLLYARLGVEYSRDKTKSLYSVDIEDADYKNDFHGNKTCRHITLAPGIGYERAFGKVLTRLEYSYNMGKKIIIDGKNSVRYTSHAVKLGLIYKF